MTDEEIEKALSVCNQLNVQCGECPLFKKSLSYGCQIFLPRDALGYISRLKVEKEQIRKETAKEIFSEIIAWQEYEPLYDCDTSGYVRLKHIKQEAQKYGVEVDE